MGGLSGSLLGDHLGDQDGPERLAWKVISECPEFRGLLASGASLRQDVVSGVASHDRSDGRAML